LGAGIGARSVPRSLLRLGSECRRSWLALGLRGALSAHARGGGGSGASDGARVAPPQPLRCVGGASGRAAARRAVDRAAPAAAARVGGRATLLREHATPRRRGGAVRRQQASLSAAEEDAAALPVLRSPAWLAWNDRELRLIFCNIVLYAVCFNLQSPLLPVLTQR
jgi:hypothetical protein